MKLKHDYNYINSNENKLVSAGYGENTVHSIHFGRYYTEEEMAANRERAEHMTREEHDRYCDSVSESFHKPMTEILSAFAEKYDVHQISPETSTMTHYRSNWDLYFHSNRGWNGKDYMDSFSLTFNSGRSPAQNMELLAEVITILENMEYKNIACRIQYDACVDENKVAAAASTICESLAGKFINYRGTTGKIKVVSENNGRKLYGFFRKNARKRYYPVSNVEILAMHI